MNRIAGAILICLVSVSLARAQQVFVSDVIVEGSLCVGIDCTSSESFGFDTIRLKENNLRIKFDDTSSTGSFSSNDWQITINDSANGGLSRFSIDDITGSKTPFTIEAGAPSHSVYVDDAGRLGLGTSTPVVDAHVVSGNTPTLRLEQDGSSGFTAQTWDVAGNEANFFIRDVTNGSRLPFRIRPSAPTSSIDINGSGDVGIGTSAPAASLHVKRTDGTAQFLVEDASSTIQLRNLFQLKNNGAITMFFQNTNPTPDVQWDLTLQDNGRFTISKAGSGVFEMEMFAGGNVTIGGVLSENSDVNAKTDITPVNGQMVLSKLDALPVSTWSYKTDASGVRHLGPMAQDFYRAFKLGASERRIASLDMAGVALASVKELREEIKVKDTRIAELENRLAALETMMQRLMSKD